MDSQSLLDQVRKLGIEIKADGGAIRCRPRGALPRVLAEAIAEMKEDLLLLLRVGGPAEEGPPGTAKTDRRSPTLAAAEPSPSETAGEGTDKTARTPSVGVLSVLSVGGGGEFDVPFARWDEVVWHPPFWRCYCCGTRRRWRLAEGSEWVCGRCHAPEPSYQIVWDGEGVGRG